MSLGGALGVGNFHGRGGYGSIGTREAGKVDLTFQSHQRPPSLYEFARQRNSNTGIYRCLMASPPQRSCRYSSTNLRWQFSAVGSLHSNAVG